MQLMCVDLETKMDNSNGAVTVTEAEISSSNCRDVVRFKGIRHRKWGKWGAEIRLCGSRTKIWLGSYDTPQQAAMAYDAALFCLRGPNSRFNFPESPSRISSSFSSSSLWSFASLSTADDIKSFSKNYALQQKEARTTAQAESPGSSSSSKKMHRCNKISISNNYEEEVSAATAGAAAFPELWKIHKNVADFGCELQLANFIQQHFHHNNDAKEDDEPEET